jgi:hypothetical protein
VAGTPQPVGEGGDPRGEALDVVEQHDVGHDDTVGPIADDLLPQ